ncbi:MAG: allophanate hydrolase [Sulfuritalea sp.]|nr:allophanate hydrolase [Sulfuritalea sp.]MDP1984170.1 allophanate hydrolase [Sulfuritalea sp.]
MNVPLTISELRDRYRRGETDPVQVAEQLLARLQADCPPEVFICRIGADALLARARQLAEELRQDPGVLDRKPLFGIPYALKDNIDVAGLPTTCACPAFAYTPERSARVVELIEAAGGLLVGKTNLDQFATGLVGTRSPYGEVRNPFNPDYVSGGSSSGSAAAVALGFAAFALGTDTAGSGRVPAGFCNLVGIKPTPGLVSSRGVFPACRSLDCVSVLSHTVADGWQVLSVLAGPDAEDPYSRPVTALGPVMRQVRIGIPAPLEFRGDAVAAKAFDAALAAMKQDPAFVFSEVPFAPFAEVAALLYDGPWVAERRLAIADFYQTHAAEMNSTVRTVIDKAEGKTAVDAFAAAYQLEAGKRMAESVFAGIDLMLVPTTPTHHTRAAVAADPVAKNSDFGTYTNFVNLLGMSALALPGPFRDDGLPAGITLIAPGGGDHRLAEFARRIEARLHRKLGRSELEPPRSAALLPLADGEPLVTVAVVGAHLSGMPLNWQLTERGGRLLRAARTTSRYRFFALPGTVPPKPGLIQVDADGAAIELELWQLPTRHYGSFVADIPAPLGIGTLNLDDGSQVQGFLCESLATQGAEDISRFGGWRAYLASRNT